VTVGTGAVDLRSPAPAKVALFRSLFRGREDVYARRFVSPKTGNSGYAPACANEWVRDGRSPLVLTERSEHLDRLERLLATSVRHLVVLRARLGRKQRQAIAQRLAAIPRDEARVLLATGRYIGEGFDDPRRSEHPPACTAGHTE
jgi:hypothetical protein